MNFQNLRKIKKKKFPTDQPIPEKQGRVRGNKNIFKVGLGSEKEFCACSIYTAICIFVILSIVLEN